MVKLLEVITIALLLKPIMQTRYFTSNTDLEKLVTIERHVIRSMQDYVEIEKRRLDFLDKYLSRLKTEYELAKKDVTYYFGNPINAYTIIKRLGPDLAFAEDVIRNKTELIPPRVALPTNEDLKASALGIVSLVNMYKLNITQLAAGELNVSDGTPLKASDCQSIGMALYTEKRYVEAIPWLIEAFNKALDVHCVICPVSVMEVIDHITQAYHELDDTQNFIEWQEKRISLFPNDVESIKIANYINMLRNRVNYYEINNNEMNTDFQGLPVNNLSMKPTLNYTELCQGIIQRNKSNKRLSCYYAHGPHPLLKLAPLKAERLHRDPDVTLFHEVLSHDDVDTIRALAQPRLWDQTGSDLDAYRNAEFVDLPDVISPAVARAARRALDLSGLGQENCEPLKVVNYGIGGMYRPHWDCKGKRPKIKTQTNRLKHTEKNSDWDRIGTILFHLSDVNQGGALTFPLLHTTVFPKKGAAVFWMNHLPSGIMDIWTMHAVCPMVHGDKWIALKWPHEFIEKKWCPVWKIGKRVVTVDMYKKILKNRRKHYTRVIGGNSVKAKNDSH